MKKINKEGLRSEKGFTMIELIIVIAILGILAAILVPSFAQMTRKSRLNADISTAKQFQTQMDLYVADHDGKYPTAAGGGSAPASADKGFAVADELVTENYLKSSDVDKGKGPILQTDKAALYYDAAAGVEYYKLDLTGADSNVKKTAAKMIKANPKDAGMIHGVTAADDK